MYYIWLKEGALKTIEKLKSKEKIGNLRVEKDKESSKSYISIWEDVFSPVTELPNVPEELIEKVTVKEHRICRGLRKEGIYHHEGTTLMVTTKRTVHSEMMAESVEVEERQYIDVSAPTIAKLKTVFSMLRQGKLTPDEDWEKDLREIEREKRVEEETKKEAEKKAGEDQKT